MVDSLNARTKIHPSNQPSLREVVSKRLRQTLAMALVLLMVQLSVRVREASLAQDRHPVAAPGTQGTSRSDMPVDPSTLPVQGRAVPPVGWRRTADGWQHVSTWLMTGRPSLGQLIHTQRKQEPVWMQQWMQAIRQVPPQWFAMGQIALIIAVVAVARSRSSTEPVAA
ncbi:MAG: hypothetical protein AAGC97_02590 [Planctomycetota bacterium]